MATTTTTTKNSTASSSAGAGGAAPGAEVTAAATTTTTAETQQPPQQQQSWDSLLARFHHHVDNTPDKTAIVYLASGAGSTIEEKASYTYQQLHDATTYLAQKLLSVCGINRGDRVILVYPPSIDFMIAFLACLQAEIIAVPVFPPHPSKKSTLAQFSGICRDCDASVALTCQQYNHAKQLASIGNVFNSSKDATGANNSSTWPTHLQWIVTDTMIRDGQKKKNKNTSSAPVQNDNNDNNDNDITFLQYTSGSTSLPKGVMITRHNLGHNLSIICRELNASTDTVVVSWLPQYHDMGLIGSYLGVLYSGGTGYYMSPLTFLARPMIWIEAISQYRATHCQAPNFAYKLCVRKYREQRSKKGQDLDLSSVRHMINGAEPCDATTIRQFTQTFFDGNKQVIYPTYGLAEHTVFVCSGGSQVLTVDKEQLELYGRVRVVGVGDGSDATNNNDTQNRHRQIVGCGYPGRYDSHVVVRIVDPETCVAMDHHNDSNDSTTTVGEIWIDSPSKAAGYYHHPEATASEFHARIGESTTTTTTSSSTRTYLRTGDLGFMYRGELFICGRRKDLIILAGRNHYPQDIEGTVESMQMSAGDNTNGGEPQQQQQQQQQQTNIIRPGCTATFTINAVSAATTTTNNDKNEDSDDASAEQVVVVMELKEQYVPAKKNKKKVTEQFDPVIEQIRSTINQEHGLTIHHIVFVRPRTIPKTSSGKIARAWCRKAYLANTLDVVYAKSFVVGSASSSSSSEHPPPPTRHDDATNTNHNNNNKAPLEIESQQQQQHDDTTNGGGGGDKSGATAAATIRNLSRDEILDRLKTDLAQLAGMSTASLGSQTTTPLISLMDSINIAQLKGLLTSSRYHVRDFSDTYLFRESTTIMTLVDMVQLGYAPNDDDDNANDVEHGSNPQQHDSTTTKPPTRPTATTTTADLQPPPGHARGLAGALGCPPGVVCVIL